MKTQLSKPLSSYLASIFERCLLPGVRPSSPAAAAAAGALRFLDAGSASLPALCLAAAFCFALPVAALLRVPALLAGAAPASSSDLLIRLGALACRRKAILDCRCAHAT